MFCIKCDKITDAVDMWCDSVINTVYYAYYITIYRPSSSVSFGTLMMLMITEYVILEKE